MKEVVTITKLTCDNCGATTEIEGDDATATMPDGWKSVVMTENNLNVSVGCQTCPDCPLPAEDVIEKFSSEVAKRKGEAE